MKKIVFIYLIMLSILEASVGKVTGVLGDAFIDRTSEKITIIKGIEILENDLINTAKNGKVQIVFQDKTVVSIGKSSSFSIKEYLYDETNPPASKFNTHFLKGTFKIITGKIGKINPKKYKLSTKSATIGIRGSTGYGTSNIFATTEGGFNVSQGGETRVVDAGFMVRTQEGEPPSIPIEIPPGLLKNLQSVTNPAIAINPSINGETAGDTNKNEQNEESVTDEQNSGKSEESQEDTTLLEEDSSLATDEQSAETTDQITLEPVESVITNTAETTSQNTTSEEVEAQIVTEDKKDETSSQASSYSVTLTGNSLRGIKDNLTTASMEAPGEVETDTDRLKIEGKNIYSLKDDDNGWENHGEITYDAPTVGGYTGYSLVKEQEEDETYNAPDGIDYDYSRNFQVYADNSAEFVVGYAKDSVIDSSDIESFNLMYAGTSPKMENLETDKLVKYNFFKQLFTNDESSYQTPTLSFTNFTSNSMSMVFNTKTKSVGISHTDFEQMSRNGAEEFHVNSINNSGVLTGKKLEQAENFGVTSIKNFDTSGSLYGTNLQGMGLKTVSSDETTRINSALFKDTGTPAERQEGSIVYDGYLVNSGGNEMMNFQSFSINRDTGDISAVIDATDGGRDFGSIIFVGTVGNLSSYYVDDDNFGVMMDASSSFNGGNLVDNGGWMVSMDFVDDVDDDSSWGYWIGTFEDDAKKQSYVYNHSTWVAGIETSSTDVESIINGSGHKYFTFVGNVIGKADDGAIVLNDNNHLEITLDFGQQIFSGEMQFNTAEGTAWDANFSGNADENGFNSSTVGRNNGRGDVNITQGEIKGKYFGAGEIKSVGGAFNLFGDSTKWANGVFKGTRD